MLNEVCERFSYYGLRAILALDFLLFLLFLPSFLSFLFLPHPFLLVIFYVSCNEYHIGDIQLVGDFLFLFIYFLFAPSIIFLCFLIIFL